MSLLLRCFIFHLKATAAEGHLGISEAFQELHLERAGTSYCHPREMEEYPLRCCVPLPSSAYCVSLVLQSYV